MRFKRLRRRLGLYGELTNMTGEILLVYGPVLPGETMGSSLYHLPPGRKTPPRWDCDGFYVPRDRVADQALSEARGPLAVKYRDFRSPTITQTRPKHYRCPFNGGIFRQGQINWYVPDLAYEEIPGSYPVLPSHLPAS